MMEIIINVPEPFQLQPFYFDGDKISIEDSISFEKGISRNPFIFDLLYNEKMIRIKPWEQQFDYLPIIFNKWTNEKAEIASRLRNRDKQIILKAMIQHIANFLSALFWLNQHPVTNLKHWKEQVDKLKVKPINSAERISFLLERPAHYHSYIQLSELYDELHKQFEKWKVQKKTRKAD